MATKNFTQFSTTTLTTGDYIVGYKQDGSTEIRTQVGEVVNLVQDSDNQTLDYNNGNLSITSGNSVTLSSFNAVNAQTRLLSAGTDLFDIFLTSETDSQTLSFDENSKDLSISSGNTVSLSTFATNTDFDSYKTDVASATATLLPTTIYQEASGFWQAASTITSQASANTILAGGNTRGAITTIGTNDAFNFRLETNNTTRINILSSGFVGIGTANNDSRVTERLTVDGNINLRETGTETRFIEIGTGRTGDGNSYVDLIGDATHADFGTRILREGTGPNANSYIRHKGTGNLIFESIDAGSLKFFTNSQERGTIDSVGNFSFGNVVPNERLTVSGNISATGVVYAQEGNSTQWNLASNTAINYTHANFLPLTGGIISGETRINNNLTVFGNLTATGITTFANTVFSTTSALSVVHIGSGPAMWVGNNGDGDIASFYDIDSNVEILHVGGNTGSFPNVGVKTSTPNKDFTVNGEISASNTIYDNVGNSTQWNTAYQNVSSQSLNKTDKVNFNELGVGTNNPLYFNLDVNSQSGNGTIGNSYGDLGLGATGSINIYPNNYLVLSPVNNIIVRPSSDTTTLPNERFTVVGNISSSNVIYDNVGNSTQWNTAYTTVQANSASWEESAEILPTVTNYLSTNNVLISSLQVNGFAAFNGSRSITDGINNYTFSLSSGDSIIVNKNIFIYDSVNFPTSPIKQVFYESGNFRTTVQPTMIFGTNSDQHLRIRTGGSTNEDIRMTFLSSGEIGIGTTLSETAAAGNGGLRIKNNLLVGGATIIDTSSTETALRVTQRGIGDAIRVEDSANPDSTPFIISNIGHVGIGTATPNSTLTVVGTVSTSQDGNSQQWNSTYLTVSALSASWEESAEIIPTVTNYLSSNNVLISSLNVFDSFVVDNQLYYSTDERVIQLSALSGNYDEGQFLGRNKLTQNNTRLINIGNTWVTKDSSRAWISCTMSSDGKYQTTCVDNGQIYISQDYGNTWIAKDSNRAWRGVSMSSDGKYQVACVNADYVYVSNDYGNTWAPKITDTTRVWNEVTMSSDGKYQFAVIGTNGQIYFSSDFGNTWSIRLAGTRNWRGIATSSDGRYVTGTIQNGRIFTSNNYGISWVQNLITPSTTWRSVAMSSDGKYQTAVVNAGQIWISSDYGNNWTARDSNRGWNYVAMSSDGKHQVATVINGQIYTSTDFGNTWIARDSNRNWRGLAMSSGGKYLTAVVNSGQIYTSVASDFIDGNLTISGALSASSTITPTLSVVQGIVVFTNLPSLSDGLPSGAVWNSNGFLRIVT